MFSSTQDLPRLENDPEVFNISNKKTERWIIENTRKLFDAHNSTKNIKSSPNPIVLIAAGSAAIGKSTCLQHLIETEFKEYNVLHIDADAIMRNIPEIQLMEADIIARLRPLSDRSPWRPLAMAIRLQAVKWAIEKNMSFAIELTHKYSRSLRKIFQFLGPQYKKYLIIPQTENATRMKRLNARFYTQARRVHDLVIAQQDKEFEKIHEIEGLFDYICIYDNNNNDKPCDVLVKKYEPKMKINVSDIFKPTPLEKIGGAITFDIPLLISIFTIIILIIILIYFIHKIYKYQTCNPIEDKNKITT